MHRDLCGPVTSTTLTRKRYFFLLVNYVSCYMWLTLLSTKDEEMMVFKAFQARAEAEAERKLGTLHTDRGGEFTTLSFLEHCINIGIQCHITTPHSPE
jgi:transposase InsO family protein